MSTSPGVALGSDSPQSKPIALAGRVPVNVTLEGGPIAVGDYLVASGTPGQAMRARGPSDPGIIGVALTAYEGFPIPARDRGDSIAHPSGHQVMLLVQNGAGSQKAVSQLESRLAKAEAEAAAMKAFICSRFADAPFCAQ